MKVWHKGAEDIKSNVKYHNNDTYFPVHYRAKDSDWQGDTSYKEIREGKAHDKCIGASVKSTIFYISCNDKNISYHDDEYKK